MKRPLCFVLMPFGAKASGTGEAICFDEVYARFIKPAVEAADLEPIRADEEQGGGVIHKPMFERLLLCDYAVADLTTANANVFYELGVRHAVKAHSTVLIFANGSERLPFDVGLLRALPYTVGADGLPAAADRDGKTLADRLRAARRAEVDSPLWQLVDGYPDVAHETTDVFRGRVAYAQQIKRRLTRARYAGAEVLRAATEAARSAEGAEYQRAKAYRAAAEHVRAVEAESGRFVEAEGGVLVDLMLSYRAVEAWDDVVRVAEAFPPPLARSPMVREQRAMALNRAGQSEEAAEALEALVDERGASSETLGLLGRVLKDQWQAAPDGPAKRGLLRRAIDAYRRGFESDWRDAYPGVNAVTLMEFAEPPEREVQARLLPVVRYAAQRRTSNTRADYWDYATLLELDVLAANRASAKLSLADALAQPFAPWMGRTTARNLALIREARAQRGGDTKWIEELELKLG